MVCPRCETAVREVLESNNIEVLSLVLGEAQVSQFSNVQLNSVKKDLVKIGFEIIENPELQLLEQIQKAVIELIHYENSEGLSNSDFICSKIGNKNYHALSRLFSKYQSITLERYIILQKIEKVKELISYGELSVKEIAFKLKYSSSQHLSNQFKAVTGMSIRDFRKNAAVHRNYINLVGGENL